MNASKREGQRHHPRDFSVKKSEGSHLHSLKLTPGSLIFLGIYSAPETLIFLGDILPENEWLEYKFPFGIPYFQVLVPWRVMVKKNHVHYQKH